jgi:hypothetical protein
MRFFRMGGSVPGGESNRGAIFKSSRGDCAGGFAELVDSVDEGGRKGICGETEERTTVALNAAEYDLIRAEQQFTGERYGEVPTAAA